MGISDFTYNEYKELLKVVTESGYTFADYHDNGNYLKPCILRHDIDFDISAAYKIAEIENEMNIKSTFFVLLRTNFYNIFAKNEYELLKEIQKMGHEIGLHFDETQISQYSLDYDDYCNQLRNDCKILSYAIKEDVHAFSFHRPSKEKLDANYYIEDIENSYSQKYFKEYKYLSDSRMCWREDAVSIIKSNKHNKLHLLTHPFWYTEKTENMKEKLTKFLSEGTLCRYNYLSENFKDLQSVVLLEDIK